ncbi:MAG: hypothetical protein ABJB16_01950, partial [Saprospiraceae bacterium]
MKKKETSKPPVSDGAKNEKDELKGYPIYPSKDDIYKRAHEEKDIDPDDMDKIKDSDADQMDDDEVEELDFSRDIIRGDLDVPGSELDDEGEDIGNEDEENNFYSIGG